MEKYWYIFIVLVLWCMDGFTGMVVDLLVVLAAAAVLTIIFVPVLVSRLSQGYKYAIMLVTSAVCWTIGFIMASRADEALQNGGPYFVLADYPPFIFVSMLALGSLFSVLIIQRLGYEKEKNNAPTQVGQNRGKDEK